MPSEQPDETNLLKWVKVSKQRVDVMESKVQNAKINNLQARPRASKVTKLLTNQANYFTK